MNQRTPEQLLNEYKFLVNTAMNSMGEGSDETRPGAETPYFTVDQRYMPLRNTTTTWW